MIAGEDHRLLANFLAADGFLFDLQVNESGQDVEQRIPLPDLLPKVGGLVAVRVVRVAGPGAVALVEGQEERLVAFEPGRHPNDIGIDREMDEAPVA